MSVLNITGENADPVKGFVFREVSEFCKKRRQDDLIDKEEMERQQREERVEKNKAWRMRRAEERGQTHSGINWDEEDQERRKRSCDILKILRNFKVCEKVSRNAQSRVPGPRHLSSDSLKTELRAILGQELVSSGDSVRAQHGQDQGPHPGSLPDIVVFPESSLQVSEVCRLCYSHSVPIIPYGTGTGLEGGIAALKGGVCVNLSRNMAEVSSIFREDFTAVVQPGVTREGLNRELRADGLWFPVDPGADASICGMCATSASGTNAVRYGTIKENTLNLEVVLSDGRIIQTSGPGSRPSKSSAGYNLTSLMVGSEGTLGLITEATVRLKAIPECVAAAVVSFPSVQAAVDTVVATLQCSVPVARIELLDEVQMRACNLYSGLEYPEQPHLFLEFHGSESEVESQLEAVQGLASELGGGQFQMALAAEDRSRLWSARHNAYWANIALVPGCRSVTTDVCVPVSALPRIVSETKEDITRHGITGPIVGHVGDGNFHSMLLFDPDNEEEYRKCKLVADNMAKLAMQLGGKL